MRAQPAHPKRSLACVAAACLLAGMVGCAQPGTVRPPPRPVAGERGQLVGLELMTWVAGDPPVGVALAPTARTNGSQPQAATPEAVLAEYASRPLPFEASMVQAWNACGVGIVSVPVADVPRVRARLAMAGPVQALQVPLSPRWVAAVSGTRSPDVQLIALDSGLIRVERSQPRLLVRAWAVPGEADAASRDPHAVPALAQVQIVPQIAGVTPALQPAPRAAAELMGVSPALPTDEAAGQVLSRLTLEAACTGLDACIFYPLLAAPDTPDHPDAPPAADEPPAARPSMGPATPEPPTLGEALLTDALTDRPRRERTLFVLIPHPPREYRLIE